MTMTSDHPEVIIIGGGHNGLVAAAYLAQAGRRVVVLEAREQLGGELTRASHARPEPGLIDPQPGRRCRLRQPPDRGRDG